MQDLPGDMVGRPSRRVLLQLLVSTAATSVLTACATRPLDPGSCVTDTGGKLIDVHCHFFNASDVSVEGFVRYVFLGEERELYVPGLLAAKTRSVIDALVVMLALILAANTISAKREAANLRSKQPRETPQELDRRQTEAVANALVVIDSSQREPNRLERAIVDSAAAPDNGGLLSQLYAEAGIPTAKARSEPLTMEEALRVTRQLKGKESKLARFIDFARLLLGSREAIAREYIRVYADQSCGQLHLVTPSFLDMHRWLGAPPNSPIADQVDVMDALQVKIAQTTPVHIHSMVGFDPRRSAEDPEVLKVVKHAVHDCGFIGVKVYPPMGFQAIDNAGLEVPKQPKGPGGTLIDRELLKLYDWCAAEHVPIMAHAENSLGAVCGFGKRASPVWWRKLLRRRKYSELRINLAHFGGFDEILDIGDNTPSGLRCADDAYSGEVWEDIIGKAIWDDWREFLFADLGYLSELAIPGRQEEQRPAILEQLARFRSKYDPQVHHLMYGTDWTMIAKEVGNNNYLSNLDTQLRGVGFTADELQNIYWRNAARYLGLGRGQKTRDRLVRYCKKRQIPAAWLNGFDTG